MSKPDVKIREINVRQPNDGLIDACETLLKQAKTGELTGICYVAQWDDSSVNSGWAIPNQTYLRTVLGELDILKSQLIHNAGEEQR